MTANFYLPLTNYLIHTQEVKTIDELHDLAHKILADYKLKTIRVLTENDDYTIKPPANLDNV